MSFFGSLALSGFTSGVCLRPLPLSDDAHRAANQDQRQCPQRASQRRLPPAPPHEPFSPADWPREDRFVPQIPFQILCQGQGRRVARVRISFQTLGGDGCQVLIHIRI